MSAVAKVVVFGATGNTGLAVLEVAVKKGLKVTAFVRDPEKLPAELKDKVVVIVGDVLNAEDVRNAVKNQDGVILTLGTRNDLSPTTVMSQGTKNIVEAMQDYKMNKISACISGFLFYELEKVPAKFQDVTADHHRQADVLKASKLDWVAVCPPHIADDPPQGSYVVVEGKMPGRKVSKYDLAALLVECLDSTQYLHQLIGIGYMP